MTSPRSGYAFVGGPGGSPGDSEQSARQMASRAQAKADAAVSEAQSAAALAQQASSAASQAQQTATQVAQVAGPAVTTGARDRAELRAMIVALQEDTGRRWVELSALARRVDEIELVPGPPPTPAQVSESVAEFLTTNPPRPGRDGDDGDPGASAYEVWRAAGNTGTVQDFLNSLAGPRGLTGADGKSVELRLNGPAVEWRQTGGVWAPLTPLSAITGPAGVDGKSVELRLNGPNLEWRRDGGTWSVLVSLSAITGPKGADGVNGLSAELQRTATAVQWRQTGGTWADLVPLSAITGPPGIQGIQGVQGLKGDPGVSADVTRMTALETTVAALQTTVGTIQTLVGKTATGVADIPALGVATSTTVPVTLRPGLPDLVGASVAAQVAGTSAQVSGLSVTSWTPVSGTRVDVVVRNNSVGPLSAGAAKIVVDVTRP